MGQPDRTRTNGAQTLPSADNETPANGSSAPGATVLVNCVAVLSKKILVLCVVRVAFGVDGNQSQSLRLDDSGAARGDAELGVEICQVVAHGVG